MEDVTTNFVKKTYNNNNLINYYTNLVPIGLLKSEKLFFEKYLDCSDRILDLGCGAGRSTIALYKLGYNNIVGIDIADKMIKSARRLCASIDFFVGDVTDLDLDDESFDSAIYPFNGLMLIPKLERRLTAFKEINRVLKKDKYFIFSTPYLDNKVNSDFWKKQKYNWNNGKFDNRLYEYGDLFLEDQNVKDIYIHVPSISEIKDCLNITGFELVECTSRLEVSSEEVEIEEQLDDGLFWVVKKV